MQYPACKSLDVPTDVLFCHWEELSHMAVSSCSAFGHYRAAFLDTIHWVRHLVYSGRVTQTLLTRWWAGFLLLLLECHHVINCEDMYVCGQFDMDLSKLCQLKKRTYKSFGMKHILGWVKGPSPHHTKKTQALLPVQDTFHFHLGFDLRYPRRSTSPLHVWSNGIDPHHWWSWSASRNWWSDLVDASNVFRNKIYLWCSWQVDLKQENFRNITRWFMIIHFFFGKKRVFKKFISVSLDSTRPVVDSTPFLVDTWPRRFFQFTRKVN